MSPRKTAADRTAKEILADSMSEADLEQQVAERAEHYGLLRYHTHRSDRSDPGWPDDVFVGTGMIVRELKRQKGSRTSKDQQAWIDALESVGVDVRVWQPMDLLNGTVDAEMSAIAPAKPMRLPSQEERRASKARHPSAARRRTAPTSPARLSLVPRGI